MMIPPRPRSRFSTTSIGCSLMLRLWAFALLDTSCTPWARHRLQLVWLRYRSPRGSSCRGCLVPNLIMVIGSDEASALDRARRSLLSQLGLGADPRDAGQTEAYLLIGLLPHHSPAEQLGVLIGRPEAASDLLLLENLFAAAPEAPAAQLGQIGRAHV